MTLRRGLWVLVGACVIHMVEEYLLGWLNWARDVSGIAVSVGMFVALNAGFLLLACVAASIGFRRPAIGLALPSLALINALFFHIGSTVALGRMSPGVLSAAGLFVPISTWLFWQARRQGYLTARVAIGAVSLGAAVMALPFVIFRLA